MITEHDGFIPWPTLCHSGTQVFRVVRKTILIGCRCKPNKVSIEQFQFHRMSQPRSWSPQCTKKNKEIPHMRKWISNFYGQPETFMQ